MFTTGVLSADPSVIRHVCDVISRDHNISAIMFVFDVPTSSVNESIFAKSVLAHVAEFVQSTGFPLVVSSSTPRSATDFSAAIIEENGFLYLGCGLSVALESIGAISALRHSSDFCSGAASAVPRPVGDAPIVVPKTEPEAYAFLRRHGVPTTDFRFVTTADQGQHAARGYHSHLAIKVVSPDLVHKSDVGGVKLHVSPENVRSEILEMSARVSSVAGNSIKVEGFLLSPMVPTLCELMVSVSRDDDWGLVLAIGLGGVWVELLEDVQLRLLPVTVEDVIVMLRSLKCAKIFEGYRTHEPVDVEVIAKAILRIVQAAESLGSRLRSLEVNPLAVTRAGPVVVDCVVDGIVDAAGMRPVVHEH